MNVPAAILIRTRLQRPKAPPGYYRRPELCTRLEAVLRHRLTRVLAPAGFGKSLAVADWADQLPAQGADVHWLRLEAGECDPLTLGCYLVAALSAPVLTRPAGGRKGAARNLLTNAAAPTDSRQALSLCLAALVERAEAIALPLVLVLDDVHWLNDAQSVEMIERLLREAPEGVHLVLIGRRLPVLQVADLQARGQVHTLGSGALRIPRSELAGFAAAALGSAPVDGTLDFLQDLVDGWPLALQLALRELRAPWDERSARARLPAMLAALETFAQAEVLSALPARQQEFLLLTSVAADLQPALADALAGIEDSADVLEMLQVQGLFCDIAAAQGGHRLQPMLGQCLRERLQRERPGAAVLLHRRAAAWHASQGDWLRAVRHALDGGEASQAAHWIEQGAEALLDAGRFDVLLDWIERMPAEAVQARPRLQLARAWALAFLHRRSEAEHGLQALQAMLDACQRDALAVRSVMTALADDSAAALEAGQAVLALRPAVGSLADHVGHTAVIFGLGAASRFDEVEALRDLQPAPAALGNLPSLYRQNLFGYSAFQAGRLDQAGLIFEDVLAQAAQNGAPGSQAAAVAAAYLAAIHYERNDPERARGLLNDRRGQVTAGASLGALLHLLRTEARLADLRGDLAQTLQLLEEGAALGRSRGLLRLQAGCLGEMVRILLVHGQALEADRALRTLLALGIRAPEDRATAASEAWDMVRLAEGRVLVAVNAPRRAVPLLRSLWEDLGLGRRAYVAATVGVTLVRALEAAGDPEGALEPLWQALSYGQQNGLVRTFVDEGPALAGPIARLMSGGLGHPDVDPEYLRRLRVMLDPVYARQVQAPVIEPAVAADFSAPRLSARETEILQYMSRGLSNKQIARALGISPETVKWYLKHIYDRLQVSGRVQAIQAGLGIRMANLPEAETD